MDNHDIYSIVERLRILEEGLDKNQKSVNQLSATFKPKTVAVLTAKKDPKNPMAGKLVGGCEESEEDDRTVVEDSEVAEDVLDKVKQSFADYLKSVSDEIKQDTDLKDKKKDDSDLKKKEKQDRDLLAKPNKHLTNMGEDPTTGAEPEVAPQAPVVNPSTPESRCVKSIALEDGNICEIHGDEGAGFEVRRGDRSLPSRFKKLDHAEMAVNMFNHRLRDRIRNSNQDYIEEK